MGSMEAAKNQLACLLPTPLIIRVHWWFQIEILKILKSLSLLSTFVSFEYFVVQSLQGKTTAAWRQALAV